MVPMKLFCQLFLAFVLVKSHDNGISTDETLTRYLLWSKANPDTEQELLFESYESVNSSNFDTSKPTKVLVHGYTDGGKTSWVIGTKNQFLIKGSK